MFLRCPKCRYRFDEPLREGIAEVHTVCPLCGTPFAVTLDAAEPHDTHTADAVPTPAATEPAEERLTDYEKNLREIRRDEMRPHRRRGGGGWGCIVSILLFLLLLLYL